MLSLSLLPSTPSHLQLTPQSIVSSRGLEENMSALVKSIPSTYMEYMGTSCIKQSYLVMSCGVELMEEFVNVLR